MEYKVLVKLYVPEIEQTYELYIPVNKVIYQIKKMFLAIIKENNSSNYTDDVDFSLFNRRINKIYSNNEIVRNTDIRNGTELVIIKN